jgi:hypothetical protein
MTADPWSDHEVHDLVMALRSFEVLTRDGLRQQVCGGRWPDRNFDEALRRGIHEGQIKDLGADLFEVGQDAPDLNEGRFDPS